MTVLLDMNMSPLWVEFLRAAGIDAIHWAVLGEAEAPDADIMAYAASQRLTILTLDLDFGILLAHSGDELPSVVQLCTDDVLPGHIGYRVVDAITRTKDKLERGALVTIDAVKTRARTLPLRQKI